MQFRNWLHHMWNRHLDELDNYQVSRPPNYNLSEYFNRYKYWLKREYKHQCKTGFNPPKEM